MSFYDLECQIDTLWGGNEAPTPSRARIFLDLFSLQTMSPEARLAKSERLEATFAKIEAELRAKAGDRK